MRYEIFVKGMDAMTALFKRLSSSVDSSKELNDQFILTEKQIDKMFKKSKFQELNDILSEGKDNLKGIGAGGSKEEKEMSKERLENIKNFQSEIKKTRTSLFELFGVEQLEEYGDKLKNVGMLGKNAFGTLSKAIKSAWVSLGPVALALGAIYVIFKLIKQAFKWNIGGITSQWGKGVGQFKQALGKLQVATYHLFKAMAPLFKMIGATMLFALNIVTKLISAITTLINLVTGNKGALAGMYGVGGNGSSNSTSNNITVITSQPITAQGAKGFQESMNNAVFYR